MPWDLILKVVLSIGVGLLIAGLAVFLSFLLIRLVRVKADREHKVKLVNRGNTRCYYHVWAEAVQPDLDFAFLFQESPLPAVEKVIEEVFEAAPVVEKSGKKVSGKGRSGKKVSEKRADAEKTGQAVAAKSGAAANILGTIASVVPGKAGAELDATAQAARDVQAGTAKAVQAPKAAERKVDALQKSGGRLGVSTGQDGKSQSSIKVKGENDVEGESLSQAEDVVRKYKRVVSLSDNGAVISRTIQVDPGAGLDLKLRIGKKKRRYPEGSFNYTVFSEQLPVDDRFDASVVKHESGVVSFPPIGSWRYFLPAFSVVFVSMLAVFAVVSILLLVWR